MISQANVNAMEDEDMVDASDNAEEDILPSSNPLPEEDAASQEKTQLEAMFDDDDDDFPSQEAPALYVSPESCISRSLTLFQQTLRNNFARRSGSHEGLLSTTVSIPISVPMAQPLSNTIQRLCSQRVRLYIAE